MRILARFGLAVASAIWAPAAVAQPSLPPAEATQKLRAFVLATCVEVPVGIRDVEERSSDEVDIKAFEKIGVVSVKDLGAAAKPNGRRYEVTIRSDQTVGRLNPEKPSCMLSINDVRNVNLESSETVKGGSGAWSGVLANFTYDIDISPFYVDFAQTRAQATRRNVFPFWTFRQKARGLFRFDERAKAWALLAADPQPAHLGDYFNTNVPEALQKP